MGSGRAAIGHNLMVARPQALHTLPDRDAPLAVGSSLGSTSPLVDPLYPEPSGKRRWIAEEPLPWLGPKSWQGPRRRLTDLVEDGTVPTDAASLLRSLAQDRASVLVIAGRSGAGKSTLLEALLPLYPDDDRRIRLRGSFETFAWETDARFDPAQAVLIAEEISGHLPTYLWGPPVGRFLGWRDRGAALVATAHGESVEDVARLLAGYPLRLPLRSVAVFDAIVRLGPAPDASSLRPVVTDIWATHLTLLGGLLQTPLFDRRTGFSEEASGWRPEQPGRPGDAVTSSSPASSVRIGPS